MGKGGSSESVQIPDFVSKLGYVPQSFGPTVAAFTPMQQSAFGNTAQAANAFGLGAPTGADVFGGMGEPTTYADGIRAYSAAPLFNQTMADFAAARPGQFNAINSMFIDPFGYNPSGFFDMGDLVNINSTPIDDTTTTTTTSTGGGGSSIIDTGVGNIGGTGFTTYGGSQDVAHQTIEDAFADYGAQISAGTALPEDNPGFNAGIKAAHENEIVTYLTNDNQIVSKKKGDLTSADFNNAAKIVDQNRLAADSMLAAGIRNVGGSYAQDDPTTGVLGSLQDSYNFVTSEIADAAAAAKEAARIAAKKRRDKKASKDRVENYKSGGQMFRGQGGR